MASRNAGGRKKGIDKKVLILAAIVVIVVILTVFLLMYFDIIPNIFAKDDVDYEGELTVHYIDVGQGDASLIQFPDGKTMLIDGGEKGNTKGAGYKIETDLPKYISNQGIRTIDYLMLTHPDEDHCSALDEVIYAFTVKTIYMPFAMATNKNVADDAVLYEKQADIFDDYTQTPATSSTAVYGRFVKAALEEVINEGATIKFSYDEFSISGEGYSFDFYSLSLESYKSKTSSVNEMSPIGILEYSGYRLVFSGDAYGATEKAFVDNFVSKKGVAGVYDCDVFKSSHHGSATNKSNSEYMLDAIKVEYMIFSCGLDNDYGHPHAETIARANARNISYYITYEKGNVILTILDGELSFGFK